MYIHSYIHWYTFIAENKNCCIATNVHFVYKHISAVYKNTNRKTFYYPNFLCIWLFFGAYIEEMTTFCHWKPKTLHFTLINANWMYGMCGKGFALFFFNGFALFFFNAYIYYWCTISLLSRWFPRQFSLENSKTNFH